VEEIYYDVRRSFFSLCVRVFWIKKRTHFCKSVRQNVYRNVILSREYTHGIHMVVFFFITFGQKPSVKTQREILENIGSRQKGFGGKGTNETDARKKKKKKKNHSFNVDEEDVGKTKNFTNFAKKTKSCCYAIDETKVLLGTNGDVDYEKAKSALKSWKQFQLGWTEVDEATRVRKGQKVCVMIQPFPRVWLLNPLEITYVSEEKKKSYSFAHTTLQGHLLAGEEKFTVEKDLQNDRVYFKVETFSKPDHILAKVMYPAVRALQKIFGAHAGFEMKKAVRNM